METTERQRARIVTAIHEVYGRVSPRPFNKPSGRQWAEDMLQLCRDVHTRVEALKMRQSYMCCYPPEPCERCLADTELLKEEQP